MNKTIECPKCRKTLGALSDGRVIIRHKGRAVLIEPASSKGFNLCIICERCQTSVTKSFSQKDLTNPDKGV